MNHINCNYKNYFFYFKKILLGNLLHYNKKIECNNIFWEQIEIAFNKINSDSKNNKWFSNKINSIMNNINTELKHSKFDSIEQSNIINIISTISEIQAYGILKQTLFSDIIEGKIEEIDVSNPDFICNDIGLNIEVATLIGTGSEKKLIDKNYDDISIHPYGKTSNNENDLIAFINIVNRIKSKETQFDPNIVNILFINLISPLYKFHMPDFIKYVHKPYYIISRDQNYLHMGALWHAFYAKKNDKIFHSITNTDFISQEISKMKEDGRFNRSCNNFSNINFVIINSYEGAVIYQNLNIKKEIDNTIYRFLMSFPKIDYDNVWLNYPDNNLEKRVNIEREFGNKYLSNAMKNKFYI